METPNAQALHAWSLLPQDVVASQVIVCERRGTWAAALRRELADPGLRLRQARSLAEGWQMLARWPASFLVIELTAACAEDLVQRLAHLGRRWPLARAAVVASPKLADYGWLVREAGAVDFRCSLRRVGPLARLAQRHLAAVPQAPRGIVETIWNGLPWSADG